MLIDFFFDFETRSRLDLKKVGTVNYATHPSTEATLLTWAFGKDGEVKEWRRGQPIHPDIIEVATRPEKFHFIAHNVLFDFMIWTVPFARLIPGLVRPSVKNITCNMALTNYNRIGGALDSAAAMLRLPYSKDKEGRRLMLKQCKPLSVGKQKGEFYELTDEEMVHFVRYGIIDTKLLRDVYYKCTLLPASERWGFEWTFIRNLRGVKIDMDLLEVMEEILAVEIPRLKEEFRSITGFEVGQRVKCVEFFGHFFGMENMQKGTVDEVLDRDNSHVNPRVVRALEVKKEVGSTSLAKVPVARRHNFNGRIYDIWNFALAHTRRWAGKGIQPQNFPRTDDIVLLEDLNITNLAAKVREIKDLVDDGCKLVKDLLRRLWLPDDGKVFYCGDFSKIEPTVLFWLLDMGPIPKAWYEEMAAEIYAKRVDQIEKESEERQVGKGAALGCIGEGEKVLTDAGEIEIQNITEEMKIWDGEEWVNHKKIAARGTKGVIKIACLNTVATPDHLFLSNRGWLTAVEMEVSEGMKPLKKDEYLGSLRLLDLNIKKASNVMSRSAVYARLKNLYASTSYGLEKPRPAKPALIPFELGLIRKLMRLLIYYSAESSVKDGTNAITTLESDVSIPIRRIGNDMVVEEYYVSSNRFESSWNTLLRSIGLTNGVTRLTGLITMDTMKPETYELLAKQLTTEIKATYDIVDCGPNNRFTINGFIVHNSGYGQGAKGFQKQQRTNAGLKLDIELCSQAVQAYRRKYWQVPEFWKLLEMAFRSALQGHTASLCNGKIHFMPMDKPLAGVKIRLPSGSFLFYPGAKQKDGKLCYEVFEMGGVRSETTYGGKLCENVVSAIARDAMLSSMFKLEEAGFEGLGTVHDEVWSQNEAGKDKLYEETMCTIPSWCSDMHVTVDSKNGVRYLK